MAIDVYFMFKNIRICHEFEGETEKSVPRITVRHHEACRVSDEKP